MKKFLFVLLSLVSMLCVSCGNDNSFTDEPEMADVQECLVTHIEKSVLENNLKYGEVDYGFYDNKGVYFKLYDFDNEYLHPYDYNKANFLPNRTELEMMLETKLKINLTFNGYYTSTTLTSFSGRTGTFYIHRFYCKEWGDEIQIFTNPDDYDGYISVKVYCNHEHYNHKLK